MERIIKEYPNYSINDKGEIFSLNYNRKNIKKIMSQVKDKKGYFRISLTRDKKRKTKKVHRLVAETFIPNLENKPQVNHKNGNRGDNSLDNLEWVTNQENVLYSINKLNKRRDGDYAHRKKYSEKLFMQAIKLRKTGMSTKKISERLLINKNTLNGVFYGYRWKHLK